MIDKIKITKELLEKSLSDSNVELDLAEVEALMDAEVEKPEAEMDTELVDMCAAILAKAYNPGFEEGKPARMYRPWENENAPAAESTTQAKPGKKKAIPFKRILLVAAVLVLIFAVALSAGAKLFDNDESDGIIQFYEDFFKINLNKDEPAAINVPANDAVSEMIINNLDNFILPEVLRSGEYEKSARLQQDDNMTTFYIDVKNIDGNITGTIVVSQYNNEDHNMTNGQVNVPDNSFRYFKELLIDGKEIIVFGNGEKSYINYSDGTTNYQISLTCDFDTMVLIAETINVKG